MINPSLNINLEKEGDKGLIKELSEIDKYIKMKILGEAIQLMKKGTLNRATTDSYKGYSRILPNEELDGGFDCFYNAKKIYDKLVGKRGATMTSSKFTKLAKIKSMTNP